jgi:putative ABC transport system substrate-binding protein
MKRRELVAALGAAAVGWPDAGGAQSSRVPRVGVLVVAERDFPLESLRAALRPHGYVDALNIRFEYRSADSRLDRLTGLAEALVDLKVDAIVAVQTPAVQAAKRATRTIPIVISAGDPVGTGLIASLAQPGGNITGFSSINVGLGGKVLELLREILPTTKRVAALINAADPFGKPFLAGIQAGARTLGLSLDPVLVGASDDFEVLLQAMIGRRPDAIIVQPTLPVRKAIDLALQHHLPSLSILRSFVVAGGLAAYGSSVAERNRQIAIYLDKVLKGAAPADLPVTQATAFELSISLRTARAIGLTIPPAILDRADEVIE